MVGEAGPNLMVFSCKRFTHTLVRLVMGHLSLGRGLDIALDARTICIQRASAGPNAMDRMMST